ncbi:MAG: response regulator transcription factor [Planctomycetes bacterium]|nr:response regulator transcription factor [Planctomycetota bacterium]
MTDSRDPFSDATVLVVDNDPGVTIVLQHVLRLAGVGAVETAPDGAAGLARLAEGGVALVICDLDMPGVSGEDLVAKLGEELEPPPVVVVSAFLDQRIRDRLGESKAFAGSFSKPFDIAEFSEFVRDILRRGADDEREVNSDRDEVREMEGGWF